MEGGAVGTDVGMVVEGREEDRAGKEGRPG